MQRRWRWLFACSLVCLAGVAWLARSFATSVLDWLNLDLLGMIMCAVIGFGGAVTHSHRRWPAILALLCAMPMAVSTLGALRLLAAIVDEFGIAVIPMFGGALATTACALYLVVAPPPRPPSDPIPTARVT